MLRAQHFGAGTSILLLTPTCNPNTQEKPAIIEKSPYLRRNIRIC
jgi:hypothetical protein